MKEKDRGKDWLAKTGLVLGYVGLFLAFVSSLSAALMILNGNDLALVGLLFSTTGLWVAIASIFFSDVSHRRLEKWIDEGFARILNADKKCNDSCQADDARE